MKILVYCQFCLLTREINDHGLRAWSDLMLFYGKRKPQMFSTIRNCQRIVGFLCCNGYTSKFAFVHMLHA